MAWRGRGLDPHCLGWLRVVRGPEKSLGCKRWVAIGAGSLRFLWTRALSFLWTRALSLPTVARSPRQSSKRIEVPMGVGGFGVMLGGHGGGNPGPEEGHRDPGEDLKKALVEVLVTSSPSHSPRQHHAGPGHPVKAKQAASPALTGPRPGPVKAS